MKTIKFLVFAFCFNLLFGQQQLVDPLVENCESNISAFPQVVCSNSQLVVNGSIGGDAFNTTSCDVSISFVGTSHTFTIPPSLVSVTNSLSNGVITHNFTATLNLNDYLSDLQNCENFLVSAFADPTCTWCNRTILVNEQTLTVCPSPKFTFTQSYDCNTGLATVTAIETPLITAFSVSFYQNNVLIPYTVSGNNYSVTVNPSAGENIKFVAVDGGNNCDLIRDFTFSPMACCPGNAFTFGYNNDPNCKQFKVSNMTPAQKNQLSNNTLKNFVVDGNIIIDADLVLNNCHFIMANGTQILVNEGKSLKVSGSTLEACSILWRGIVLEGKGSKVYLANCTIKDAYRGVESIGINNIPESISRVIDVKNTSFIDNYWGVFLSLYTGQLNLGNNNRFRNEKQVKLLNLSSANCRYVMNDPGTLLPNGTGGTVAGIEFRNVSPNNGNALITGSKFYNLHYGIICQSTNMNVDKNTTFTNILEAGIWSNRGSGGQPRHTVVNNSSFVNMGTLNLLNFGNVIRGRGAIGTGIIAENNINLMVENSVFNKTNAWGIYYAFNNKAKLQVGTVKGNQFYNNNFAGILAYESVNTDLSFKYNYFDFTGTPYATGIIIEDVMPYAENQLTSTVIGGSGKELNIMDNVREGIRVINRYNPQIIANEIHLSGYLRDDRARGIYTAKCISSGIFDPYNIATATNVTYVTRNKVDMYDGGSSVITTGSFLDVGIEARDCKGAVVSCNHLEGVGRGLWFEGDDLGLQIGGNFMNTNDIGLVLNSALFSQQGDPSTVYLNQWLNPIGTFDTYAQNCNASGADIYYPFANGYPYQVPLTRNGDNNLFANNQFEFQQARPGAANPYGCGALTKQQEKYTKVIQDSITVTKNTNEARFQAEFFTMRDFTQDTVLVNSDTTFLNYYNAKKNGLAGKLAEINYLISIGDYTNAKIKNDALNCTCINSTALQAVNRIYLETFAAGITEFTQSQHDSLETIAKKNSLEYGYAVIQARVMLRAYSDTTIYADSLIINPSGSNKKASLFVDQNTGIKIYPNPVTDVLNIENVESGLIQVKDLNGKLVLERNVTEKSIQINLSEIPAGVYVLHVQPFEKAAVIHKLIIQK